MSQIDLNNPPSGQRWRAELQRDEDDSERFLRLSKEAFLFLFALGLGITFVVIALRIVLDPASAAEDKKWAFAAFTSTASGMLGYLLKK